MIKMTKKKRRDGLRTGQMFWRKQDGRYRLQKAGAKDGTVSNVSPNLTLEQARCWLDGFRNGQRTRAKVPSIPSKAKSKFW